MARYMRKWWLEHPVLLENGEQVMFRGWINTLHGSRPDPECTISGDVWGWKDEAGVHGGFRLDASCGAEVISECEPGQEGLHGCFLIGECYPMPLDISNPEIFSDPSFKRGHILERSIPISSCWPRFNLRIEDMLNISRSYTIDLQ